MSTPDPTPAPGRPPWRAGIVTGVRLLLPRVPAEVVS